MKITRLFFVLLAVLTVLRWWLCAHFEVQPREAYWYLCSTHPDWAYFDAPGGVPLLVAISTAIFGPSAFGIRFFMPLFAFGMSTLLYLLSSKYVKGWMAAVPVIAINVLPIFNRASLELGGAMPSLMFSMLAVCSAWKALKKEHENAGWWLLAGISAALGEFMHLGTAIVLLSILFAAASTRKFRHEVIRPAFACFLIPSVVVAIGLIIWNRHHDWVWLATGTLRSALSFSMGDFFQAMGEAILQLNPLVCMLGAYTLFLLSQHVRLHVRPRMILAFCIPPVLLWGYLGLLGISHAWLLVFPLSVLFIVLAEHLKVTSAVGILAKAMLATAAIMTAWGIFQFQVHAPPWATIAAQLQEARKSQADKDQIFLVAKDADMAAILSYHLRDTEKGGFPPVFVKESQGFDSQFSLWPRYDQFVETEKAPDELFTEAKAANPYMGRPALYITDEDELPQTIQGAFTETGLLEILRCAKNRKTEAPIWIYRCTNYQTMPL